MGMWFDPESKRYRYDEKPDWLKQQEEQAEQAKSDAIKAKSDRAFRAEEQRGLGMLPGEDADLRLDAGESFADGLQRSILGRGFGAVAEAARRGSEQVPFSENRSNVGMALEGAARTFGNIPSGYTANQARLKEMDAYREKLGQTTGGKVAGAIGEYGPDLLTYAAAPMIGSRSLAANLAAKAGSRVARPIVNRVASMAMNVPADIAAGLTGEAIKKSGKLTAKDVGLEAGFSAAGHGIIGTGADLVHALGRRKEMIEAGLKTGAERKAFVANEARIRREIEATAPTKWHGGAPRLVKEEGKTLPRVVRSGEDVAEQSEFIADFVRKGALTGEAPLETVKGTDFARAATDVTEGATPRELKVLEGHKNISGLTRPPSTGDYGGRVLLAPKAGFLTTLHESQHALQRSISPAEKDVLRTWLNLTGDIDPLDSSEAKESLAYGVEKFLAGNPVPQKVEPILQKILKKTGNEQEILGKSASKVKRWVAEGKVVDGRDGSRSGGLNYEDIDPEQGRPIYEREFGIKPTQESDRVMERVAKRTGEMAEEKSAGATFDDAGMAKLEAERRQEILTNTMMRIHESGSIPPPKTPAEKDAFRRALHDNLAEQWDAEINGRGMIESEVDELIGRMAAKLRASDTADAYSMSFDMKKVPPDTKVTAETPAAKVEVEKKPEVEIPATKVDEPATAVEPEAPKKEYTSDERVAVIRKTGIDPVTSEVIDPVKAKKALKQPGVREELGDVKFEEARAPKAEEPFMARTDPEYQDTVDKVYAKGMEKSGDKHRTVSIADVQKAMKVGSKRAKKVIKAMVEDGLLEERKGRAYMMTKAPEELTTAREAFKAETSAFEAGEKARKQELRTAQSKQWQDESQTGAPRKSDQITEEGGAKRPKTEEELQAERQVEPNEALKVGLDMATEAGEETGISKTLAALEKKLSSWKPTEMLLERVGNWQPVRRRLEKGYLGERGKRFAAQEVVTNEMADMRAAESSQFLRDLNDKLIGLSGGRVKSGAKEIFTGKFSDEAEQFLDDLQMSVIEKALNKTPSREYTDDVIAARDDWMRISDQIGDMLEGSGIGVRDGDDFRAFSKRQDWAIPLLSKIEEGEGLEQLVSGDYGMAGSFLGNAMRTRESNIEKLYRAALAGEEVKLFPKGREVFDNMRRYTEGATRLASEADNYGYTRKKGELWTEESLDQMVDMLAKSVETDKVKTAWIRDTLMPAFGKNTRYTKGDEYWKAIGSAEAGAKLFPFSALSQLVQSAQVVGRTGMVSDAMTRGFLSTFDPAQRKLVLQSGATVDSLKQALPMRFDDDQGMLRVLHDINRKVTLMPNRVADEMVRYFAGTTGLRYGQQLAADVAEGGKGASAARRELRMMGVNPEKIEGGTLSDEQLKQFVNRFVRTTQTQGGRLEQAGSLTGSPMNQTLFQFMGFMLKNAYMTADNVMSLAYRKGAIDKDYLGALDQFAGFGTTAAGVGSATILARDFITSKPKDPDASYVADTMRRGLLNGLTLDMFERMWQSYKREDMLGIVPMGPAVRDGMNAVESVYQGIEYAGLSMGGVGPDDMERAILDRMDWKRARGEAMSYQKAKRDIEQQNDQNRLAMKYIEQSIAGKGISAIPASRMFSQAYWKYGKEENPWNYKVRKPKAFVKPRVETEAYRKQKAREDYEEENP